MKQFLTVVTSIVFLFTASSALAHAKLVMAMPADNSVAASPKTVMLHFNEKLEPAMSGFTLANANGTKLAIKHSVDKSRLMLQASLEKPLAPGVYTVTWHAVTAGDGHRTQGRLHFTVQ